MNSVFKLRKEFMRKLFIAILIACLMLVSCGIKEEESLTSVYDTEQYQTYKRLERLAASSADNSKLLYKENIMQKELQYSVYESSDLKVLAEQSNADITNYLLYINGEYLTTIPFRNYSREREELTIYYIDITEDLKRDVVMFCEPPAGTSTTPYWSFAYDVYNNRKINFFDEESGELSKLQKEQLTTILDNDENFMELFPEYCGLGESGAPRPFVDMFGKVYYEMAIWGKNSYIDAIGSILVMFEYDKDNNCFDVNEVLYMPLYVTGQDISEVVDTTPLEVERLKKVLVNETEIFQINNGNIELIAYCDDEEMYSDATRDRYTHLLINGEDFVLNTFGKPFYLREAVPPRIIWYDWNNDGIEDFIFWGENDRAGCLQYAFASTKDGQFYNLGSVSWEKDEGLCSYQRFPYMVTLLDDYMVKIDLASANISEIYDIKNSKFLEHCAIPLGMYDEEGKVTEIGRYWDFAAAGLYEKDIKCSVSDDGSLTMSIISYIGVGYSTYNLDCGFVFNWKLGEDGYELIGIDSFCNY